MTAITDKQDKIKEFIFDGRVPFDNRLFFIQHLKPYDFFFASCKGKRVLEIGTGEGFGSYLLSKNASCLVALDIELSAYDWLKRYQDRYAIRNLAFVNANGIHLPFKDNSFDRIIASQVIEHIAEDKLLFFLKEICRVLKSEGSCMVCTLNIENSIKKASTYEKCIQHYKEFNRREFEELLNKVFPSVELLGLDLVFRHRFFRRLKRWGFLKYDIFGCNPVRKFYDRVSCADFKVSRRTCKTSLDLIGLCTKKHRD
jgi:ubiquinone/menaquinone biosynthesis C-methylase UbiE